MDTIDMNLIMLLLANSRRSYVELAENLNLSVNAIHKRIQLLLETGVIRKFTAKVNLFATKAIVVFISGVSQLPSVQQIPEKLKAYDSIYWLAIGGGKYLYIGAYLKNLNELTTLVNFIKKEVGIPEPTIGIISASPSPISSGSKATEMVLSDLDRRIIRSLKDNARKAIADVADELKVSAKTIRRRLTQMIQHNLIELSIEWYPDKSNDIFTLIDLHLTPDATLGAATTLLKKYAPFILFYWAFVNLPNTITYVVWTNNMNELQQLRENLEKEDGVTSVVPNILYTGFIFETWRDHLIEP
jgi:Lrp/AsnC family leucine-responsive transcriptional regulator